MLNKHGLVLDNINDELINVERGWGIPLVRKMGDIYYIWEIEM